MKRLLPKTSKNPQGFTLIELMVVITILAILALIGMVAFQEVQKRARDAQRISEIDSIAKALETHFKVGTTLTDYYQPLVATWFEKGEVPVDPRDQAYCLYTGTAQITTKPTHYTTATCPDLAGTTNLQSAAVAEPSAGTKYWAICTATELNAQVHCKYSAQ